MTRTRRAWRLGWGFRVAVFLLWLPMQLVTKRDWQGLENLENDPGGIIVAPNHTSWFDPLVVAHMLWRVPIMGPIITSAGQVKVYRETAEAVDAVRDAVSAVERGECIVVYPEGTITRDPGLWPMQGKTGAARIALASGRPLLPLAQWGAQDVMPPYRKRLRLFPRKTMHVRIGAPVDLSDLASRPLDADTLHIATDRLMDAMTGLLADIRDESPPKERMVFDRNGTA